MARDGDGVSIKRQKENKSNRWEVTFRHRTLQMEESTWQLNNSIATVVVPKCLVPESSNHELTHTAKPFSVRSHRCAHFLGETAE